NGQLRDIFTRQTDGAVVAGSDPRQRLQQFDLATADDTGNAKDFSCTEGKRNIPDRMRGRTSFAGDAEILNNENRFARLRAVHGSFRERFQVTNNELAKHRGRRLSRIKRCDVPATTQNRNTMGHAQNIDELVPDQDDAVSALRETAE